MEATPHRRFGRKTLGAGFVEVVAALGTGVSVIFPSLMIGVDQRIVAERRNAFGELIDGVLLCGSEHFESLSFEGNNTEVCRFLIQSGSRPY
jgi:hypothetical protein